MAGHSQFKNIMHRKGAQDAKRAKIFTKLLREITVAARMGGCDPTTNSRLRAALIHARASNVPKDNLDRAIGKAQDPGTQEESLCYEAFGPSGGALLIEVFSDNRNRTASEIRALLNRHEARLADVKFLFHHEGRIVYRSDQGTELMEAAIVHGAIDFQQDGPLCRIGCTREDFSLLCDALETRFGPPEQARLGWFSPLMHILPNDDAVQAFHALIEALEDRDDVQQVWTNVSFEQDPEPKE